jgi:hypothetical protein
MQWDLRLRAVAPELVAFAADQEAHVAHIIARLAHPPIDVPHVAAA